MPDRRGGALTSRSKNNQNFFVDVIYLGNFVESDQRMDDFIREIFFYRNYYFDFFKKLNPRVQRKFSWTLQLIATTKMVPQKYFKHLTNTSGLYEIRVQFGTDIYRVFSFFDEGNLVILINGFQKKSQKTPRNEIERAEKLKRQYFDEKNQ